MTSVAKIMTELKKLGTAQTLKTFARHGAPVDRTYGVKVGDMKILLKQIKGNQQLALDLYATGNADAMYLAGLAADGSLMSKKEIEVWAKQASWQMISEYTVPWVASENKEGVALARKWIKSQDPKLASSGWATYASIVSTRPDDELDLAEIEALLEQAENQVHQVAGRLAYTMNHFVISVGCYVKPLSAKAKLVAKKIGTVHVDMGNTACKVPLASDFIAKVAAMGRIGQKRKNIKC